MAYRPVKALIHLNALQQNLRQVKTFAPDSKVLAIIKSNGYGHGIERVAGQLTQADGYGVACIDEAIVLRQKGFLHPIVLLEGLFSEAELSIAIQHRLEFAVHSFLQLEWLKNSAIKTPLNIWLKLDTGMHRLGFQVHEIQNVIAELKALPAPVNIHLMSHFASADESEAFTQKQLSIFNQVAGNLKCPRSIANSAGVQRYPESHLDWVRPGIMLYGACATSETVPGLKPVMTLMSQIISLKWIEAGETVGYGQTWQASRRSLIAVVAIGYGDGYPRHAPSGTPVLIHGERMPLVGRVSMDMITVDVTDLAEKVTIGDEAILWGQGLPVDVIADACGTIGYELLCGVTQRVPRVEER
ncbi:Alanine racemase, catabolic [Hydrogenovibrio crunogenus]|uniref:Alanine racemase n=1 Tax=Hydrogenovibrio crunogenus TaxID=39765 RepID=A0A4P7P0F5_9GAMM|nr:alanine racemase [Hydrogenovibrio crunogenus]QBZ83379.1 Alanine racemase, catabolic [Hydrogenovibrio crunogenus]